MRNKSTLIFIISLAVLACLLGYNYFARPFARLGASPATKVMPSPSPEPNVVNQENQSEALSDSQRISQLIAVPLTVNANKNETDAATDPLMITWIKDYQPGLVTIFGQNIDRDTAADAIAQIRKNRSLASPVWVAVDHEGGMVQRLNGIGFTKLPNWSNLCWQSDSKFYETLASSASELKAIGVDVVLAPVVDVGSSSALNSRVCSAKTETVINKSTQFLAIFQKNNILPVLKHFPGLGQTSQDLHKKFDRVTVGAEDASVYRMLLSKNARLGVMVAPVGVKNQYPDIPCVLSPDCVAELSRNFPQTLIFTDALEMKANFHVEVNKSEPSLSEIAERAVQSGNQVLVFGPSVTPEQLTQLVEDLTQKYQTDELFKARVDAAVAHINNYKGVTQ